MYDKLDKQTANKHNISKVAYAVSRNYEQATCYFAPVKVFPKDLENIVRYYSTVFLAAAQYYYAAGDKERCMKTSVGFGKVVARLRLAEAVINKAMLFKGIRGTALELGRNLLNLIGTDKALAENENFTIYMDRIPEESALEPIEALNMITPKTGEAKACPNQELISAVVPMEIINVHREYEEYLATTVAVYREKVGIVGKTVKDTLANCNISGIPEDLWLDIQTVQKYSIEKGLQDIKNIKKNSE